MPPPNAAPLTTEKDDTIAAALNAAFDAADEASDPADNTPVDPAPAIDPAPADPAPASDPADPAPADPASADPVAAPPAAPEPLEDIAPTSLPPEARALWKDAPAALRQALVKREQAYTEGLNKHFSDARRAQDMDRALQPFMPYLEVNGGVAHLGDLMRTGARLQGGTAQQKADTVAQLIKQYGVDIATLDTVLSGQAPAAAPPLALTEQDLQARIDAAANRTWQQRQQESAMAGIKTEIEQFAAQPEHAHYAHVREDMAMLLDGAARRNEEMTLKEAYTKACRLHPQIGPQIQAEEAAKALAAKRTAAVSINGTRGGTGAANPAEDLRGALEHAWDTVGRV